MKLLYIHLLMGLLLTYIDAFVAFFKESGNKYHFEKVEKPGWEISSAICASAWCIKSRRCVYSHFVLYANQCSSWFVVRVVSPESRRFWLTFISWQNAPSFLFMVSFAICSNINVCVFKRNQIQQRQDMTGNTDRHVNIQSIIISIASLRFETDHCV